MASTNLILAVPSADSSVSYEIPGSESATLNFGPGDIDGLKLDGSGGLVISFIEGGNVTITNFQDFIDNGNTLSLSDGTNVDPKLLFNALHGQNDNPFPTSDVTKIGIPTAGEQKEIALEPGKKYLFNFDLSETKGADVKDGKMVVGFEDGGKIIITNYEEVMAGQNPPELSLASKTCVVTGDELITNIQELAKTNPLEITTVTLEEKEEETKPKSKVADADMDGKEDIGPGNETDLAYKAAKIKPAAGDEEALAEQLAAIDPAAGGAPGGRANSGYGYGSRFTPDPFITNPDIGPINPTQLAYRAPRLEPSQFVDQDEPAPDDNPNAIGPDAKFLDETNLSGGPISTSGAITVDFGADGPGGISPNGSFSAGGSVDNNILSSNGEKITVSVVGNSYVGTTAGGDKVFELVVNSETGGFTFTQYLPLDHADATNPDDRIVLNFGIVARDGDGDPATTSVQIVIADDGPNAAGGSGSVDETDFGATISTSGSITVDFGQDGPGNVRPDGSFMAGGSLKGGALTSAGIAVVVTPTANGYVGKAGTVTIFTLTIDPPTGDFVYTQYKALDHADVNDPNDFLTLTFGIDVVDFDGDAAPAPIVITVFDDAPGIQTCGCGPKPDQGLEIVDETNLVPGPVIETGRLDADFGADVPGSFTLKPGSFSSSGSKLGGNLTHNGVPVVVTLENGAYVGKAGTVTIFTLEVTASSGDYKFTLLDNFDHADGTDADDIITLDFGVIISDFEGDSSEGKIRIHVKDDAPIARNDVNAYDTTYGDANGNVITGLNGGVGAADTPSTDAPNKVVKIAFGTTEIVVPATGTVSIDGDYGTLTIAADGTYTYKTFEKTDGSGNSCGCGCGCSCGCGKDISDVFTYTLKDFDNDQSIATLTLNGSDLTDVDPIITVPDMEKVDETNLNSGVVTKTGNITVDFGVDGPGTVISNGIFTSTGSKLGGVLSHKGTPVVVSIEGDFYVGRAGSVTVFTLEIKADGAFEFKLFDNLDHADAADPDDVIKLNFGFDAIECGCSGGGGTKAATLTINVHDDAPIARNDVNTYDTTYGDANGNVISGLNGGTNAADTLSTDADNKVVRVSFGATAVNVPAAGTVSIDGTYGKLTIAANGTYTYKLFDQHIGGDCSCGCGTGEKIQDVFTYTLRDGDNDTSKATLTLTGKDLTDTVPVIIERPTETVDETNLVSGALVETGKVNVDFKADEPGVVAGNGYFRAGGSMKDAALTSEGVAVVVTFENGTYVGRAGTNLVFTLQIAEDGNYTFKLLDNLDHGNTRQANEAINLIFGVRATDCDGDKANSTIVVKVLDDVPVANDDNRTIPEGGGSVTGNVTTNDVAGQDTPATITKVVFGGVTYNIPTSGANVTINGTFGTLVINKDGAYTYTSKSNAEGVDSFTYTYTDRDGDSDTAILKIDVLDKDTVPSIIKPADEIVDETNLASGVITETGSITADFKDDGPGSFAGNGSFSSSGSRLGNKLTSNGVDVVVSYAGGVYTGKAGATTVFTMTVGTNGAYTFKLFEQLDHADGSNPDDIIALDFGAVATDADGDTASTTITVRVRDDAPDAKDDGSNVAEGGTVSGNVTSNDVVGQDIPGKVVKVSFGGTVYDVPASGQLTINATNGTLKISQNGAWTYTAKANADGTDQFFYTLRDYDGDIDTACLSIKVDDKDTIPSIIKPADEIVDETNLASGVITETGSITADFKDDGPGSFAGNGSFSSSGSRLGNKLTSNGVDVVVSYAGGVYTGKAGATTVFTMTVGTNGAYTFKLFEQLDHADGSNPDDIIALDFGVVATDTDGDTASTTITVRVRDDAPDAKDDGSNVAEGGTVSGNVTSNDVVGQDIPGKVVKVSFGGTVYDVPTSGQLTINGVHGTLKIAQSGAWTYTAKANADGTDQFFYTLRDYDGDIDTACLSIKVDDKDTIPSIIKPADEIVDETNLVSGVITETGSITADFKDDGPGSFAGNGSFSSAGSRLGNKLTSNGVDVVVSYAGGVYTGKAGATTVFTLQINPTSGAYIFKLFEQLDHADGSNPDDIITLDFGVEATDTDGDKASTTLTVRVRDDAPDAKDDGSNVAESGTVSGNVTSNDVVGQDAPGKVIKVSFGGTVYDVPVSGQLTINGTYGVLKISQGGAWTYTAKTNADGTDQFFYTLRDYDGDTDTACLSIKVEDTDTIPSIIKPADEIVDETALASGVITEIGNIVADFKDDGPGSIAGNGSFSSSGSRLGNKLSSNGVDVVVSYAGGVYTGTAGGTTVFTMTVGTNGAYTFKLFEQLDHADGSNPDDVINLNFGVVARDADGDTASTTVTVRVRDDAPVVTGDFCTLVGAQTQISSNALSNDNIGQDTPGRVTAISYGGRTLAVPASGSIEIAGLHGILIIAANGAYTYKHTDNVFGVSEEFVVTVTDFDGDNAPSQLQINLVGSDLQGTGGRDTINGSNGSESMFGNGGADWLYGYGGDDYIDGGAGDDLMEGGFGNDELIGREGNDTMRGGEGNDRMFGDGATTDTYAGNDIMYGDGGDDTMYGRRGDDMLDGGTGNDVLYGEEGNDILIGGAGNDHLIGGLGNDTITGGSGADTFWFLSINEGVDTIKDFSMAEGDKLELNNVLTNFDPLTDAINDFVFATHSGGNTTILVNNSGTGVGGATSLFVLENLTVSVSDLFNNGSIVA